ETHPLGLKCAQHDDRDGCRLLLQRNYSYKEKSLEHLGAAIPVRGRVLKLDPRGRPSTRNRKRWFAPRSSQTHLADGRWFSAHLGHMEVGIAAPHVIAAVSVAAKKRQAA